MASRNDQTQFLLNVAEPLFFSDYLFLQCGPLGVEQFGGFQAETEIAGTFREQRADLAGEDCAALFGDPAQGPLDKFLLQFLSAILVT
jgi:hypothetical protein